MRRTVRPWALICACFLTAACSDTLPQTVTCAGVRKLKLGAQPEDVLAALGQPRSRIAGEECAQVDSAECWRYHEESFFGGVRLWVDVDRTKGLLRLHSVFVPLAGAHETLFVIDSRESREYAPFSNRMSCEP